MHAEGPKRPICGIGGLKQGWLALKEVLRSRSLSILRLLELRLALLNRVLRFEDTGRVSQHLQRRRSRSISYKLNSIVRLPQTPIVSFLDCSASRSGTGSQGTPRI